MNNQQTTAIIFSVLLLSTLAHVPLEHQRTHQVGHAKSHNGFFRHNLRDNSSGQPRHCRMVCPVPSNSSDLSVVVNTTSHIIGVVNTTAHVAIAIDLLTHMIAVFNGTSGAVVIVDVERNTYIYIKGGVSQDTWHSSHESFSVYINSLASLRVVWELGLKVGHSYHLDSVEREVLEVIAGVLIYLSVEYSLQLSVSVSSSLKLLIEIDKRVSAIFGGGLKYFVHILNSVTVAIHSDFLWFIAVLEGLAALIAEIRGGVGTLVEKGVKLDLKAILEARSGVQVFIYIVNVLIKHVNVSIVLEGVLSSGEKLLELLVKLGGNVSKGVTGVLKVVLAVLGLLDGSVTIEVIIDTLIEFSVSVSGGASLKQELTAAIQALLKLGDQIKASGFEVCLSFLKKLRDNQLVINGLNISAIIAALVQVGTVSALVLIVRVLILLQKIVKIEVAVSLLLFALIVRLTTVAGLRVVETVVGVQFNVTVEDSGSVNVLAEILKGVDISLLYKILKGDFSSIPVIGKIYGALSVAIKTASGGSLEISVIFKSAAAVEVLKRIVALLVAALHGDIDASLATQIVGHTTEESVSYYTEVSISDDGSGGSVHWDSDGNNNGGNGTEISYNNGGSNEDGDQHHGHHNGNHGNNGNHYGNHGNDHERHGHHDRHHNQHKERHHVPAGHARNGFAHHAQGKLHHHAEEKHHLHEKHHPVHEKEHTA